jgi:hypothetical protein
VLLQLEHIIQVAPDILHRLQLVKEVQNPAENLVRLAQEVRDGDAISVAGRGFRGPIGSGVNRARREKN